MSCVGQLKDMKQQINLFFSCGRTKKHWVEVMSMEIQQSRHHIALIQKNIGMTILMVIQIMNNIGF